jgi:threonine dehydratase
LITLTDIQEASKNISEVVFNTPLSYAPILSELTNKNIFIKKDNLQVTGSFKIRGAFNRIALLCEEEKNRGVIAASAGNHAQGVAFASQHFDISAVIVMPENTPMTKINGVKSYGAEVILHGCCYDEAYKFALEYSNKHKKTFVHPFEDKEVIAGQGTIALEILEANNLNNLEIDTLIVPIGGGGLISGVATAVKNINPNIKVIGIGSAGAPALAKSFQNQKIETFAVKTIADGIAVRDGSKITLPYMLKYVDEVTLVDDEQIANAILFLMEKQKIISEGAGAVGIASLLHKDEINLNLENSKNIAVLVSGGNIDVTMLSLIIEKGLIKSNRKMKLTVTLIDKPGSLQQLTDIFTKLSANIVHIGYDRTSTLIAFGNAHVTVHLETKGHQHQEEIRQYLSTNNYEFSEKF